MPGTKVAHFPYGEAFYCLLSSSTCLLDYNYSHCIYMVQPSLQKETWQWHPWGSAGKIDITKERQCRRKDITKESSAGEIDITEERQCRCLREGEGCGQNNLSSRGKALQTTRSERRKSIADNVVRTIHHRGKAVQTTGRGGTRSEQFIILPFNGTQSNNKTLSEQSIFLQLNESQSKNRTWSE